jgi:hypothetical protein
MRNSISIPALAFAGAAVFLAGCQYSPDMTERSFSYNESVAQSTDQLLLINIVRASKREPRYFTRFGSNTAQTTFNPTLAVTVPFNGMTPLSGTPQIVATPQGTVQNLVLYDNLDDQKYQQGAMEDIDAAAMEQFWSQGIQPDLLGLLFVSAIEMPASELPILHQAYTASCGPAGSGGKFCGSDASLAAAEGYGDGAGEIAKCWDPKLKGIPIDRRDGVDYAIYINDPAFENFDDGSHPEFCFQVMLRALLALGLHPNDIKPTKEVDADTPKSVVFDARFRAEMIKLGYKVAHDDSDCPAPSKNPPKHGKNPPKPAACEKKYSVTKEASDTVFTLAPNAVHDIRTAPQFRDDVLQCALYVSNHVKTDDDNGCHEPAKPGETPAQTQERWKKVDAKYEKSATEDMVKAKVVPLDDLKITLEGRSFESVIYYLGEIVRSQGGVSATGTAARPYYLAVLGRQPWNQPASHYEERLLDVQSDPAPGPTALSVKASDGKTYWIPDILSPSSTADRSNAAGAARINSIEYPSDESLLVLTIVNALWGLKKTPSTPPAQTISVGV